MNDKRASQWIGRFGEAASVKTKADDDGTAKFATANDFRRAFGTRWANKGWPVLQLQQIMRHSSIQTTLNYYAEVDAYHTAAMPHGDVAWPDGRRPTGDAMGTSELWGGSS